MEIFPWITAFRTLPRSTFIMTATAGTWESKQQPAFSTQHSAKTLECTPKMRHTVKQLSYCEENRDDVSTKKTKDQPRVQDCCGTGARERQERSRGGAGLPGGYLDAAPLAGGVGERSGV